MGNIAYHTIDSHCFELIYDIVFEKTASNFERFMLRYYYQAYQQALEHQDITASIRVAKHFLQFARRV